MHHFSFATVNQFHCFPGALQKLHEHLSLAPCANILVITDKGIVESGLLDKLKQHLNKTDCHAYFYTDVVADPPESVVYEAVELAKLNSIDIVIGFGGGSPMDTAKLVARLAKPQPPETHQALSDMFGVEQCRGVRLPLILIPTTAGTGSEATPVAIVTTGETTKAGVVSSILLPDIAILDAELTLGLPATITAATGIDAMVHAIEAITSKVKRNLYSDMLAREALRLLSQSLPLVNEDPSHVEARQDMLLGAFMAGQAFANSPVGAVHALAYPLGGHFHLPHGLSNALVLPHVIRFNAEAAVQDYAEILQIVASETMCKPYSLDCVEELATYFEELSRRLSLPTTLSQCGISEGDLDLLADEAMLQTRLLVNNPRSLNRQQARDIYAACL